MGSGDAFDVAIADFAVAYAGQVNRDWQLFTEAIKSGVIEARGAGRQPEPQIHAGIIAARSIR